jgi:hypothetical protein
MTRAVSSPARAFDAALVEQLTTAALALDPEHLRALEVLAPTMDTIAADDRKDLERVAALARGFRAVFADDLARALTDGAETPAEIARRYGKVRRTALMSSALSRRA